MPLLPARARKVSWKIVFSMNVLVASKGVPASITIAASEVWQRFAEHGALLV
jgi:hypothetical protein